MEAIEEILTTLSDGERAQLIADLTALEEEHPLSVYGDLLGNGIIFAWTLTEAGELDLIATGLKEETPTQEG